MSDFLTLAGENAVKAAEDYGNRNLFDAAIQSMTEAKNFNPELTPMADNYIAAYKVQQAVQLKQSLYKVLGIEDVKVSSEEIKKQFKKMALMLHPDKNGSVVAEAAFKSALNAYDVIYDDAKRSSYDFRMGFHSPPRSRPQPQPHNGTSRPTSQHATEATMRGYHCYTKSGRRPRYIVTRFRGGRATWEPEYWEQA